MKIKFQNLDPFPEGVASGNRAHNRRLGIPRLGSVGPVAPKLAVCGGGPSLASRLDKIRAFDGEIWAINGTWRWLKERGIDATFYGCDPHPKLAEWCQGASKAVISDIVDPSVCEALKGAQVEMIWMGPDGIPNDCSAAATAPFTAFERGHQDITFFGCDGSFQVQSNVDRHEDWPVIMVKVGEKLFLTRPDMILITEAIHGFIKDLEGLNTPVRIRVDGAGFLAALVEHGDYEVTHVSPQLVAAE